MKVPMEKESYMERCTALVSVPAIKTDTSSLSSALKGWNRKSMPVLSVNTIASSLPSISKSISARTRDKGGEYYPSPALVDGSGLIFGSAVSTSKNMSSRGRSGSEESLPRTLCHADPADSEASLLPFPPPLLAHATWVIVAC